MRTVGAVWGIAGVLALLGFATLRLTPLAVEAVQVGLSSWQWLVAVAWIVFMIITEGYDGFYRRLAPRVAERARHIKQRGDALEIVLAPLYCFGYFRAPARRMVISYVAIVLIICAVLTVQQVPQPWRGIIDIGVVAGLVYGAVAIVVVSLRATTSPQA